MLLVASPKDLFLNESGKLHALRAAVPYVPYVPSVPTWSRALCLVLSWLTCLVSYVVLCLTCLVPYILSCLTSLVPNVCLMCLVPRAKRVLVSHVS